MKACCKCGEAKPFDQFYKNGPGKLRSACKVCEVARDSARRPVTPRPPPLTLEQRRERDKSRRAALAALRPPRPPRKPPRVKVGRMGKAPEVLTHNGLSMTRSGWAKYLGLSGPSVLTARLLAQHWPAERALSQDVAFMNQRGAERRNGPEQSTVLVYEGQRRSIEEWAALLADSHGMTVPALRGRLGLGWPVWRALGTKVRPHRRKAPKIPRVPPEFVGPKRPRGRPRKPA